MFSKKHMINLSSILLIAGINGIYMLIFTLKPSIPPVFSAIAFILLFLLIIRSVNVIEINKFRFINKNSITTFLILLTILLTIVIFKFTDRLPHSQFIGSVSDLYNGLFILNNTYSYPDNFLGFAKDILFTRILGVIGFIFFWLSFLILSNSIKESIIKILFLIVTPVLYLSIIIIGEFVFMSSLVIMLTLLPEKYKSLKDNNLYMFLKLVVLIVLTYVNILAVLFTIIYAFYFFRNNVLKAAGFLMIYFMGVILFLYLTGISLYHFSFLGGLAWLLIICSIAALYIGWSVSNLYEVFFSSGVVIFLFIAALSLTDAVNKGFNYILSGEYGLNLVTFILPVFFFLVSIHDYKVDKFLGKLIPLRTLE